MKEKTGSYLSANKKCNIRYRICLPEDNAKGIIQIVHGMCEYFDRYEEAIEYFTSKGFVVCGNDHIGHGYSAATEEELGYFGTEDFHCPADDLKTLNDILRKTYRSLPYILFGHSMGSFVVRDYITRYPETVDGCIICGTSGSNKAVGMGLKLASIIGRLKGDRHRSSFLRKLSFSGYNKRFKAEDDPNSWLTREPLVREKYAGDKFCSYTFTVNGYKNMFGLLKSVSGQEWAQRVPLSLPIFVIAGRDDPVGNYGAGCDEVFDLLNDREVCMLKYKLYDNARHELFNESNRYEVYEDVAGFCDEVIEGVIEARRYG